MTQHSQQASLFATTAGTWLAVACVFVGVSFLSVPVPGINEPHYLTKARAFADPDWGTRDFFLQSANAHYVFYTVVGPLTRLLPLAAVAVLGRVVSLALLAVGWTMLGRRLQLSDWATVLAAALFCGIAMTGNFSGEWIIGGFEGKVPAYGFATVGLARWLKAWRTERISEYAVTGLLLGASVAFHPVVGLWFCIGITGSEVLRQVWTTVRSTATDGRRWLAFLASGSAFAAAAVLSALPGLIPAVRLVLSSELPPDRTARANYIQVFWRLAHHLDPSTFPARAWVHTGVLLLICTAAIVTLHFRRRRRVGNHSVVAVPAAESAMAAPEAVHHVAGEVPTAGLLSTDSPAADSQTAAAIWSPLLLLLLVSGVIAAVGTIIGWHTIPVLKLPDWQWRAAVLKFYPFRFFDAVLPITTALAVAAVIDLRAVDRASTVIRGMCFLVVVTVLVSAWQIRPMAPGAYSAQDYKSWQEACHWLKNNTPPDALIFGPREGFGLKWFAERAEFVCFKDCPQDAAGILEWNRRLWQIHDWSEASYGDGIFDKEDTQRLHRETGITYILTRQLGPFELEPVTESGVWRIYSID